MLDSNMRTITVRFSSAEHRVLNDLAAAQDVSVESFVREALGLSPVDAVNLASRPLRLVRRSEAPALDGRCEQALPTG